MRRARRWCVLVVGMHRVKHNFVFVETADWMFPEATLRLVMMLSDGDFTETVAILSAILGCLLASAIVTTIAGWTPNTTTSTALHLVRRFCRWRTLTGRAVTSWSLSPVAFADFRFSAT